MADNGWLRRFDDLIITPDGKKLVTLRDAIQYLGKTVPKAEHDHPKVLNAADHLTRSADKATRCSLRGRQRCWRSTGIESGSSIQIAKTQDHSSGISKSSGR